MQTSFSELEYATKKKLTRRDRFLAELEAITPWAALEQTIAPFYPGDGGPGRPPKGLTRMLRMYIAQQCFGYSDEGIEDAIYDSQAIRRFVGIDLARDTAPDATTLLKFRHLLEQHQLTESIFNAINAHLCERGLFLREGTIVDATLIAAPPSTKNQAGERDPDMHQSKKGNQWYFGMKAHIGVDAHSGLVHTVIGGAGRDTLQGGGGDDILLGGTENDQLYGEAGNDTLDGGAGADHMEGGAGNDTYLDVTGEDTIFDNQGNNTISLAAATGLGTAGLSISPFINSGGGTSLQLDIALDNGETLKIQSAFFGNQSTIQFANGDALDLETLVGGSLTSSLNLQNSNNGGMMYGGTGNDLEWREAA